MFTTLFIVEARGRVQFPPTFLLHAAYSWPDPLPTTVHTLLFSGLTAV